MSADAHANFPVTRVVTPPSPADSGTHMTITPGTGILLPEVDGFNLTVWSNGVAAKYGNAEIPRVTAMQRTNLASGSNGASLPQATIHVADSSAFDSGGGTFGLLLADDGTVQVITYTGKGSGTLTGCTGGTGTMTTGDVVVGDKLTITRSSETLANGIIASRSILSGDQVQATITKKTLTDAEAGGGGGLASIRLQTAMQLADGAIVTLQLDETCAIGNSTDGFRSFKRVMTGIPVVVGALGTVVLPSAIDITDIPDDTDPFDLYGYIAITDMTGSNVIEISKSVTSSAHDTSLSLSWTFPGVGTPIGSDLSWDEGSHSVLSTAGGVYIALMTIIAAWD